MDGQDRRGYSIAGVAACCLDVLMQLEAATPGQLGAKLGLTTGSVTAMLDRMERMGT